MDNTAPHPNAILAINQEAAMDKMKVMLDLKVNRVVVVPDWPSMELNARTKRLVRKQLQACLPSYAKMVARASMESEILAQEI